MGLFLKLCFIGVFIFSIFFAAWYPIHKDVEFGADIGRDFHLLRELDEKKIVLIGPKSSTNLFHGPLWTYVNYPAFVLGGGNPVVVAYGWVIFVALFGIASFFIAGKLFGKETAYLFGMMAVLYAAFHAKGMFNPHGAMFLIPLAFFFFIKYIRELKPIYLILNIFVISLIIEFQMADGIPFLLLSILAVLYKTYKTKKFKHFLVYLLVPVFLINFIAFDIRHDQLLSKQVLDFISPKQGGEPFNYLAWIPNRIDLAFQGTEILRRNIGAANLILFLVVLGLCAVQIRSNRNKDIYLSFLYFYFGFFILSFINKGQILYFYLFPIFPLVLLIFSSFNTSRYRKPFLILFFVVLLLNLRGAILDFEFSKGMIGKDIYSWKFLNETSAKIFQGKEEELGYFVYSPDVVAYEPKYAVIYNAEKSGKKYYSFQKKPITYLFIQPPPRNNPYMKDDYWIKNQLNIDASPSSVINFPNGYKLEKFELDPEQISVPFDPSIDPGLHFR